MSKTLFCIDLDGVVPVLGLFCSQHIIFLLYLCPWFLYINSCLSFLNYATYHLFFLKSGDTLGSLFGVISDHKS